MPDWENSPIVSFSRNGQAIVLGRSGEEPTLHLKGSTGLGVAPVDIAKSDRITSDGSIVRGVRYTDRELFIPLLVEQPSSGDLSLWRRELTRLLAPFSGDPAGSLVDVQIEDPATGTVRMIRGIYTDGLDGEWGDDTDGSWQSLGLTFDCADPWWLGPERLVSLQVNPGSKPFLSNTVEFFPVMLAQSVVVGEFDVTIEGDGPVFPSWEIIGPGEDLRISNGTDVIEIDGEFKAGTTTVINTNPGIGARSMVPDRWADTSLKSRLFPLNPGRQTITASLVGATTDTMVRLVYRERYLEGV